MYIHTHTHTLTHTHTQTQTHTHTDRHTHTHTSTSTHTQVHLHFIKQHLQGLKSQDSLIHFFVKKYLSVLPFLLKVLLKQILSTEHCKLFLSSDWKTAERHCRAHMGLSECSAVMPSSAVVIYPSKYIHVHIHTPSPWNHLIHRKQINTYTSKILRRVGSIWQQLPPLPHPPSKLQLVEGLYHTNLSDKTKQNKNKKSTCSNNPYSPKGLLHSHLPYIINHHKHLSCFMQLYNRMTAQVLAFP